MKGRNLFRVSMDDARRSESFTGENVGNDLLILNVTGESPLMGRALQPGFLILGYCENGRARLTINSDPSAMRAGDLLVGIGDHLYKVVEHSDDFSARIIIISRRYARDCIVGLHHLWRYLFFVYRDPILHLTVYERSWLQGIYAQLLRRVRYREHAYRAQAIAMLARIAFFDLCDLLRRRYGDSCTLPSRAYAVFEAFVRLLSDNFRTERDVAWYADKLCITPKYLSEVSKSVSGNTARQWIINFVLLEAKVLLQETDLSVKEIAQRLGFPNQSFFGKYFKNSAGISPSAYKAMN